MRLRSLSAVLLLALAATPGAESAARAQGQAQPQAALPDGGAQTLTEEEAAPEAESPAEEAAPPAGAEAPRPRRDAAPAERATHTVVAGDTLGGIAHRYGITTAALALANGITPLT